MKRGDIKIYLYHFPAQSAVPVVSTAFRPIDTDELEHNPFRVSTPMLATSDSDTPSDDTDDGFDYSLSWMVGQIGHHIHDPYELYEKAASQ